MWMPSERSRDHFNSVLCLTQDYKNRVTAMCPRVLRLSVNIKDTAGCCVFRKQVSLHKQLYKKAAPPLSWCVCLHVFSILWAVSVTAPLPSMVASVYYAHGHIGLLAQWHNCDAPSHDTVLSSTRPLGSADIFLDVNRYMEKKIQAVSF